MFQTDGSADRRALHWKGAWFFLRIARPVGLEQERYENTDDNDGYKIIAILMGGINTSICSIYYSNIRHYKY